MNKEHLKELLDHIGNEVNLLRQVKLKRRVLQAFMDLLEDKQDMVSIFDEYSKKSIEVVKQNKRYRKQLKSALNEIEYVLYSRKPKDVKVYYLKTVERDISEMLEEYEGDKQ